MYSHMYSPLSYNAFPWSHDEQYNLKIIQKLGLKPSIKKRSGHRRGVRQGFVGSEGDCSSRIFHLTPRGKVPFKDFVFPHVDKYFFSSCHFSFQLFSVHKIVGLFFSLANFFRFDPRAGLHLFWFITILSRSFIKIDERNGVWEHIKLVEKLAGKKKKIK